MIDPLRYAELKASGKLPSPSGAALALIEKLKREDVSLPEICRLIQSDPALTGRLLKIANSALYARPRPAAAVTPEILMMLGLPAVRALILAFALIEGHREGPARRFDYRAFWSASLAEACAAQMIGAQLRVAPAAELFTLGLIAEIGRLALASLSPERYDEILLTLPARPATDELLAAERSAFDFDHLELGSQLAAEWGLPRLFQQAIRWHALPETDWPELDARTTRLAKTLSLAHGLAESFFAEDEARASWALAAIPRAQELGVLDWLALADAALASWREWGEILTVATRPLVSFVELAAMPQGSRQALRVLVVEDDAATRRLVEGVLTKAGFTVRTAADGEAGLVIANEWLPEIVVTDVLMPGLSGLELIRALRAGEGGQQFYIVVITVLDATDKLVEAFACGADDYVVKPLDARVLLARLQAGVRITRLRQELIERNLQLAEALARAETAALTDVLTGFPNRRYAMQRLSQECAAAERSDRPLSLLMLDLDHFKAINDRFGHDAGDAALVEAARRLRAAARASDVVCRFGGEEFLVIAPDTPLEAARRLGERLNAAVKEIPIVIAGKEHRITISVGVAEKAGHHCANVDQFLKAADAALYAAKAAGRDRVCVAR